MIPIGKFAYCRYTTLHYKPSHGSPAVGESRPPEVSNVYEIVQNDEGIWFRVMPNDFAGWVPADSGEFTLG